MGTGFLYHDKTHRCVSLISKYRTDITKYMLIAAFIIFSNVPWLHSLRVWVLGTHILLPILSGWLFFHYQPHLGVMNLHPCFLLSLLSWVRVSCSVGHKPAELALHSSLLSTVFISSMNICCVII